jgi:hypothetical protein
MNELAFLWIISSLGALTFRGVKSYKDVLWCLVFGPFALFISIVEPKKTKKRDK